MSILTRRTALAGLAGAIATGALAACGGGTRPTGGAGSPTSLSVWILTGAKQPAFENSFNSWNTDHPDAQFAMEFFANDAYKEKIRTAIGAGNAPSLIFNWGGGPLQDYIDNNNVVDLSGKVDALAERCIPSIYASGEVDGKQFAVPNNDTQPVLFYANNELFDQHGVTPPTTWDELLTAIDTFKGAGVTPISLAGQSVWPELMYIQYLTDRIGGPEVFSKIVANEPDAWSDPAIGKALESIKQLVDLEAFGTGFGSVAADSGADAALVHTGQAAMLLQGSWVYGTFKQDAPDFVSSGKLGHFSFPTLPDGAGDPANVVGNPANFWSVSASADQAVQDSAIAYLNDYNLNDQMVTEFLDIGVIPAVKDLQSKISGHSDEDFLGFAYDLVINAPHFQLSWDQALAPAVAQTLLTNLSSIFLGQQSPDQFVTAMNASLGS